MSLEPACQQRPALRILSVTKDLLKPPGPAGSFTRPGRRGIAPQRKKDRPAPVKTGRWCGVRVLPPEGGEGVRIPARTGSPLILNVVKRCLDLVNLRVRQPFPEPSAQTVRADADLCGDLGLGDAQGHQLAL